MGLDGISINQLRVTPENNSAELNSSAKFNVTTTHKIIDGLSEGQKVDPDRENEHEKPQLNENFSDSDEDESIENKQTEEIIKYDLSQSNKYVLKLDEESNNILIIEKETTQIVQRIGADELSNYVGFLSNSQGSMINRKF